MDNKICYNFYKKHFQKEGVYLNKILILEDEESVNRGIAFSVNKAGYEAVQCYTIKAVSYTHLDVYKRQEPGWIYISLLHHMQCPL